MPSFAKAATTTTDPTNPLLGLWKDESRATQRARAAEILGTLMPAKIAHIRELLKDESDPSSPLWTGHVLTGDYKQPRMVQPDRIETLLSAGKGGASGEGVGMRLERSDIREGETIVMPSEVVVSDPDHGQGGTDDEDEDEEEVINGKNGHATSSRTNGARHVTVKNDAKGNGAPPKGVRVGSHWFEVVPRNKAQVELLELVTREHEDLYLMMMDLRVWLELEIPLVEDGNSFGADVQGHLIKELLNAQNKARMFINSSGQHHIDRIKLISDWVKNPNVMDYPAAIAASDRFDNTLARSNLRVDLMLYGGLLTKFQRNWEKVINPKKSGSGAGAGMY